jgi:CO dehydrogenase/acetyl-CoA synthase beta subunit
VRKAIDASDLMDEALVEHAGAKDLIAHLEDTSPDDDLYDAKVTVLGEQIDNHVKEEEGDMFPKAVSRIDACHSMAWQLYAGLLSHLAPPLDLLRSVVKGMG